MTLKILTVPNPVLRTKSLEVKTIDKKLAQFITNFEDTLAKKRHPQGVGLSAPQVGKTWRIFSTFLPEADVTDRDDLAAKRTKDKFIITTYINPQIITASKTMTLGPSQRPASPARSAESRRAGGPKTKGQKPFDKAQGKPILEGCLSIPSIYGPVWRHEWIELKYQMLSAKSLGHSAGSTLGSTPYALSQKRSRFSGFTARVIQHELDHLNGILFTDYSLKQNLPLYEEVAGKLQPLQIIQRSPAEVSDLRNG